MEVLCNIEVDIEKSYNDSGEGKRYIFGKASTPDLDTVGHYVLQKGLDISYFVDYGFFNWDHQNTPDAIVGYPYKEECYVAEDGFYVAGELFKGLPLADKIWDLVVTLKKSNSPRTLYFSLEGKIEAYEGEKPHQASPDGGHTVISKAKVYEVAITKRPVNPQATMDALVKSLVKAVDVGYVVNPHEMTEGIAALRAESVDEALKNLCFILEKCNEFKTYLLNKGELTREEAFLYSILTCPRCLRVLEAYDEIKQ
jgi:hypothetical protein